MNKVAAVVILYNPSLEVLDNINTYANQVDNLFIVDNSEIAMDKFLLNNISTIKNAFYIQNGSNIGIAAALNIGARKALEKKCDFLLTMDQDSRLSPCLVENSLKEFNRDSKIGLVAPYVVHLINPKTPSSFGIKEITVAMTSGSILSLSAFVEIGDYLEKFYIDYVDNEYCLRMASAGFKIIQMNSNYVYHSLGNTSANRFLHKKVYPTNHSAIRWYYRTRNRLYIYKKYKKEFPKYVQFDKIVFLKDFLKVLLYEKEKLKKMKAILFGFLDYKKDKFNKLSKQI